MSLQSISILVVEDEAVIRFDVAEHLRDQGFAVLEASSGDEAIDILQSGAKIDLVFSDIHMPGAASGLDLARWILARAPHIAIVLTSGADRAVDLGPDLAAIAPVQGKPYDPASLLRRIRAALDGRL